VRSKESQNKKSGERSVSALQASQTQLCTGKKQMKPDNPEVYDDDDDDDDDDDE